MKRHQAENRIAECIREGMEQAVNVDRSVRHIGHIEFDPGYSQRLAQRVLKDYFPPGMFEGETASAE
jgi:hypothetical protein